MITATQELKRELRTIKGKPVGIKKLRKLLALQAKSDDETHPQLEGESNEDRVRRILLTKRG